MEGNNFQVWIRRWHFQTVKEETFFEAFFIFSLQPFTTDLSCWQATVWELPKAKGHFGNQSVDFSVGFEALEFRRYLFSRCLSKNKWSNSYGCQEAAKDDKGWNVHLHPVQMGILVQHKTYYFPVGFFFKHVIFWWCVNSSFDSHLAPDISTNVDCCATITLSVSRECILSFIFLLTYTVFVGQWVKVSKHFF